MEFDKGTMTFLAGIIFMIGGVVYGLTTTGVNLRCYNGWELQENGSYSCTTSSGERFTYCSEVYSSKTGRHDFYCREAVLIEIEQEDVLPEQPPLEQPLSPLPIPSSGKIRYICDTTECILQ